MIEPVIILVGLVALIFLGGIAVCFYFVFAACRGIFRAIFATLGLVRTHPGAGRICTRALCRAPNAPNARFCRRCGKELPGCELPFTHAIPEQSNV